MVGRIVAFGALLLATHVAAESAELTGDALKEQVAGAMVEIDTPLGVKVPLRYGHDGRVTGEAPGNLAYMLGAPTDIGRWWIAADRLCQRWTRWFDGAIHCLRISQDGSRIFWRRDDGESGTGTITASPSIARAPSRTEEPPVKQAPPAERLATIAPNVAAMLPTLPSAVIPPAHAAPMAPAIAPPPSPTDNSAVASGKPAPSPAAKVSATVARAAPPPGRPAQAIVAAPPNAAGTRQQDLFRVVGVDLGDVLNVRGGPSADHEIVGAIMPEATGVRLVGPCLSVWCPVSHRGVAGWVNRMYLARDTGGGPLLRDR